MSEEIEIDRRDSVSIGSAAKGVALKIYVDFSNVSDDSITKKKIDNLLKVEAYFKKIGRI